MNYLFYQLKVVGILFLFYFIYICLIRRSSRFHYKRIYLLSAVLFSFILPFINIHIKTIGVPVFTQILPEVIVGNYGQNIPGINFEWFVERFMQLGSFIFFMIILHHAFGLVSLIKQSEIIHKPNYKLVEIEGNEAFTFWKLIFFGRSIPKQSTGIILAHEKVHVNKIHSFDNILIEIAVLMQWFNPVIWLIRKEIRENHEFEADRILLDNGVPVDLYQQLLLNQMFHTKGVRFSSFNYNSFIKNRIKMMTKKNSDAGRTRFLLATVLSLLIMTLFAFKPGLKSEIKQQIKVVDNHEELIAQKDTTPYILVDKSATFNGKGLEAFNEFIIQNVIYPKEAVSKKIEGKVYVQFVVNTDGKINEIKVLRSSSPILSEEAIRVVKSSPVWVPAEYKGAVVKQIFTLPVVFKLQK